MFDFFFFFFSLSKVPVFVQIHDPRQHYYMGVCEGKGIRFDFEMVHLKLTPPHCKYLTGNVTRLVCRV
jgi:Rab3 GTPase-activating protein catalytic subunit